MANAPQVICARLPDDLDTAIRERAAAEGLSPSEMIRAIVTQWLYGTAPTVDDGYHQGRNLAIKLAHETLARLFANAIPETYEQAVAMVGAPPTHRRPR